MKRLSLLLALAASLAGPASAQDATEERIFEGPIHFCGYHFSMDARAGERVSRQQGPDFFLYSLQSVGAGFGIYEGFHPDTHQNRREPVRISGLAAERLSDPDGSFSYLIPVPGRIPIPGGEPSAPPAFVHLYGLVWRGNDGDLPLASRVKVGTGAEIGCTGPTVPLDPPAGAQPTPAL